MSRRVSTQENFQFANFLFTLKSERDAIKSSNSFVAVEALCEPCNAGAVWLSELCDRAEEVKQNKQS